MKLAAKWTIVIVAAVVIVAAYSFATIRRGFSTRDKPSALEASLAMSARDMAIPAKYKTMKNPVSATPEAIHEGMAHWADHCAACHANDGSGDTMYGRTMYPRPPDMRLDDTQEMSDGELYYTIKNGVRMSGMPAFGDPGDDDVESWKLVPFIHHLAKLSDQEELEMEHLNPKGPDEMREEMEEDQFLNGGNGAAPPKVSSTRH